MREIEVALVRMGSEYLLVALLSNEFGSLAPTDKNLVLYRIQVAARASGIDAKVVAIWENGRGARQVLAATDLFPACDLLTVPWVRRNVSVRLQVD